MPKLLPLLGASVVLLVIGLSRADAQSEAAVRVKYDASVHEFIDAIKRADVAHALSTYAPDATFVEEDGSLAHGRPSSSKCSAACLPRTTSRSYALETMSFHAEGNLAYAGGTEHIRLVDKKTGKVANSGYRFLVVYRATPLGGGSCSTVWKRCYRPKRARETVSV